MLQFEHHTDIWKRRWHHCRMIPALLVTCPARTKMEKSCCKLLSFPTANRTVRRAALVALQGRSNPPTLPDN